MYNANFFRIVVVHCWDLFKNQKKGKMPKKKSHTSKTVQHGEVQVKIRLYIIAE